MTNINTLINPEIQNLIIKVLTKFKNDNNGKLPNESDWKNIMQDVQTEYKKFEIRMTRLLNNKKAIKTISDQTYFEMKINQTIKEANKTAQENLFYV
jgi:hypothetical protein